MKSKDLLFVGGLILFIVFLIVQSSGSFWAGFWPNFFSDLLVGVIIAYLITQFIEQSKLRDAELQLAIDVRKEGDVWLELSIINIGRETFRSGDLYWHLYIDSKVSLSDQDFNGEFTKWDLTQTIDGIECHQYSGELDGSLFPKRSFDCLKIKWNGVKGHEQIELLDRSYFRMSTAYGMIPEQSDSPDEAQEEPGHIPLSHVRKVRLLWNQYLKAS